MRSISQRQLETWIAGVVLIWYKMKPWELFKSVDKYLGYG